LDGGIGFAVLADEISGAFVGGRLAAVVAGTKFGGEGAGIAESRR